ncbi:MAG: DUF418 domain-containing protein [Myxococcota bacterium]|nr:DUF418 domain-containing protein [Deltaproteobacteria bacterium]MDQ3333764.1 DUF418 domain-containing protein [Myxococcota bacterium]
MTSALRPVTPGERIEELDVVRGFALLGVFLMNVEFFGRSVRGIGEGMPPGLTGIDWFASWFVAYFVQGKFWTMFAMLFGMGFAVMLMRAERAERPFLRPYLRRILALAVFGAAHFIFLWSGDILFSYAVAAGGLLVLLYGKWKPIVLALVALIAIAFVPGLGSSAAIAGSLAFISLMALYMRSEKKVFKRIPVFSFLFLLLGTLGALASIALWLVPDGPKDPRVPVTTISGLFLLIAFLSARFHNPVELRPLRLGVALYVLPTLMMIVMGTVQYVSPPDPKDAVATVEARKEKAEKAEQLAEHEQKKREEERVLSSGTYADAVGMRARDFPKRIAEQTGMAVIAIGMFLIGFWFVRSGIMQNVSAHLPLFRKLTMYGLPLGIGLGILGSAIATTHTPGSETDGFLLANALVMLGSLPASLGYMGLVVLALNSRSSLSSVRVLAPAGRMALTNYLLQSVVSTLMFYGYGAGYWGLARSWQVAFVIVVFGLQVAFSHWWLSRFRYGPLEGVWRAFTYRQLGTMRTSSSPSAAPPP